MHNLDGETIENVVIIGSGPAGWSAALYAARAGLRPILFEGALTAENQENGLLPMGQLATTTFVENYPGFPQGDLRSYLTSTLDEERLAMIPESVLSQDRNSILGLALVELMRRQALDFGVRIVEEDVASVDFTNRPLKLTASDGAIVWTRTVIVATGASAKPLGLPSEERFKNNGVSYCAVCDGAAPRFKDRPLAVVGGGDVAVQEAEYLVRFASKVYLVHRRDELRASKALANKVLSNPKITVLWNRVVDEILGDELSGVTGLRLKSSANVGDSLTLDVSGVFVAIGRRPNVKFLRGALDLTDLGYIKRIIPFRTNTSVEGVFVAGDVGDDRYCQAIVAASSGAMAALDAERYIADKY